MLREFFTTQLFQVAQTPVSVWQFILLSILLISAYVLIRKVVWNYIPKICLRNNVADRAKRSIQRSFLTFEVLVSLLIILYIFQWDYVILERADHINITIRLILQALIIFSIAKLIDWFISYVLFYRYYRSRNKFIDGSDQTISIAGSRTKATNTIQYIVYALTAILIVNHFNLDIELYDITYKNGENKGQSISFMLTNMLYAILILLFARILTWIVTQIYLFKIYNKNNTDTGTQLAINQLINYIIYVFAIVVALENMGLEMKLIWGGAAALLVGIGLGLQQTFNDFASGVVLLFERSVKVGDVLEFDKEVGIIRRIGLRSSLIDTRDNITMVVPNSKLVNKNVTNWTHFDDKVLFEVHVGVAYGSDTSLVKKLLLESIRKNKDVINIPTPFVRFLNFGDSSLDFGLYFFSKNYVFIEDIRSDIRLEIDRLFRLHNISIPFPQRDVWIKSDT